jgi:hypothetical protein
MGTKMKGAIIVVLCFAALGVLLLSGAMNPLMADLFRKLTGNSDSNETTPEASETPDETETSQPSRNISIYYSFATASSISFGEDLVNPDSGSVFLKASMKIENNGYDSSFSTNPVLFSVTTNGTKYDVDVLGTGSLNKWRTLNVANGTSFTGTLVFQVPSTASTFNLGYYQPISLSRFSIVWIED